jgi:Protein of unknown function (DUF4231)
MVDIWNAVNARCQQPRACVQASHDCRLRPLILAYTHRESAWLRLVPADLWLRACGPRLWRSNLWPYIVHRVNSEFLKGRRRRQELTQRVERLTAEEEEDWALVYAWTRSNWYDKKQLHYHRWYRAAETSALTAASVVTVLAALGVQAWITASVAAFVTVVTGIRRIGLFQENWAEYSDAWAQLNALVSEYRVLPINARSLDEQQKLVRTVDALIIRETQRWKQRRLSVETVGKDGSASTPFVHGS